MDIKRSILIVALAVVSYLMVLEWNQDYGQAALPTQNAETSSANRALMDTPLANRSASPDVPTAGEVGS